MCFVHQLEHGLEAAAPVAAAQAAPNHPLAAALEVTPMNPDHPLEAAALGAVHVDPDHPLEAAALEAVPEN